MILSSLFSTVLKQIGKAGQVRRAAHLLEQAIQLHKDGDLEGARRRYEEVLSKDPDNADANYLVGIVYARCEEYEAAELYLRKAVALRPESADAHIDLGNVYWLRNNRAAAEASYRNALALAPDAVPAYLNLARLLLESGRADEALDYLRAARELEPARNDILRNLVTALVESGRHDEAVQVAERAAAEIPDSYDAQLCLGLAYQKSHRVAEAMECYDRALSMRDDDPELHNNRGTQLQEMGRLDEALASYERALELRPDFPLARFHRGLARLMVGDYARGWIDYEARLLSVMQPPRSRHFTRWNGESLKGRVLLVYGEQGLGDEIMFASCLPEIVEEAGRCIIECAPKLERLFARSFPRAAVYSWQQDGRAPTVHHDADFEVPIGSLPLYRRHSLSDFPWHRGYLVADPLRVQHWRERLEGLGPGLKVGISWRGGTYKTRTSKRSIPPERWLPIFRVPGIRFVSLQYTEGATEELQVLHDRNGVEVVHWRDAVDDYDETAALVTALDLVVSVCTAVIHLGGALGKPVWVMVPCGPEWRYGSQGETMPWYPSVRLFRQPALNEWEPVIERVALELQRVVHAEPDG